MDNNPLYPKFNRFACGFTCPGHAFVVHSVLYFGPSFAEISAFGMIVIVMSVNKVLFMVLLAIIVQACGQTGPLYLPDSPPPIYVPKQVPIEED